MKVASIRYVLLLLLLFSQKMMISAQDETVYRLEAGGGVGMGFGYDDVNSRLFRGWKPSLGAMVRFPLNPSMAVKVELGYLKLGGSARNSSDFYPANPLHSGTERLDYKFSGAVYDLDGIYELHLLPYGWAQNFRGFKRIVPYMQMGLGLTYGAKANVFTVNIPIGAGVKWKVAERVNLALDWTFRFTPSDRLDGLEAPHGIHSSEFRNKDHYSVMQITFSYDLSPKCPACNKDYN